MDDRWVPNAENLISNRMKTMVTGLQALGNRVFVADLINRDELNPSWNETLVRKVWNNNTANEILQIPLGGSDIRCWGNEQAGTCTVKTLNNFIKGIQTGPNLPWRIPSEPKYPLENRTVCLKSLVGETSSPLHSA